LPLLEERRSRGGLSSESPHQQPIETIRDVDAVVQRQVVNNINSPPSCDDNPAPLENLPFNIAEVILIAQSVSK